HSSIRSSESDNNDDIPQAGKDDVHDAIPGIRFRYIYMFNNDVIVSPESVSKNEPDSIRQTTIRLRRLCWHHKPNQGSVRIA
ncbi:MAG: hypothetical protein DYG86_17420, partial [Chloroflexi bacterium CFX2]|nr:hypothetical protein [Chloroflexi bacterium CFX2]